MASVERRYLVPDDKILSEIFPGTIHLKPTSCCTISNTFNTCTFSVQSEIAPLPDYPKELVVRLEASRGRLATVVALQRLAHAQLTDVVPSVLHVGATTTADGRPVEYCITAYCTGTIPLEDVWDTFDQTHQLEFVDSVVHAIEKLQRLDLGTICQSLTGTPCVSNNDASQPVKISIGGPELGYFPDVKQFLDGLVQASNQRSPSCKLLEINGGIVLESTYEDIGRTELSRSDLDDLQHHVVFCHNDVEPRNILARKISSPEEKAPRYELVAIIDWETAGFYPFTYEYAHKDTILGSSNLSLSWYTLFKQRTSHMLPPAKCHTNLMRAVKIIDESKKRRMTRNVGIRFQAKWMDMEQMEKSSDPRQGWVRKTGAQVPRRFTKDDKETLELEVLKELDYV